MTVSSDLAIFQLSGSLKYLQELKEILPRLCNRWERRSISLWQTLQAGILFIFFLSLKRLCPQYKNIYIFYYQVKYYISQQKKVLGILQLSVGLQQMHYFELEPKDIICPGGATSYVTVWNSVSVATWANIQANLQL